MRNKILTIIISCCCFMAFSQPKINLETLNFNENFKIYLKGKKPRFDPGGLGSGLPGFYTKQVRHFCYGNVSFSDGGEFGEEDMQPSFVQILISDTVRMKISGLILSLEKEKEAREMLAYLEKTHGKPKVLRPKPTPRKEGYILGHDGLMWKDAKNGTTILFSTHYVLKGEKQSLPGLVYIIKDNTKLPYKGAKETPLTRLINMLSRD